MPNVIKYSTGATPTGCLRKGNILIGNNTADYGATFFNGINPPNGGYTIYLNKASGGPSIYCPANDTQLISITNQISPSYNYISNGGNFANGTSSPFLYDYSGAGGVGQVVSIENDKPYVGSTSTNALQLNYNGGRWMDTTGLLTVGQTYTFSFWAKITSGSSFTIGWNNQNGSGETNSWSQGNINITTSWQRYSQVFTYNAARNQFYFSTRHQTVGTLAVFTEFQVTSGSAAAGPGLTTAGEAINWFKSQDDKIIANFNYEGIVTNGLVLNLDAGFSPSMTTLPVNTVGGGYGSYIPPWYDISGNNNSGSLINGPTYSSANSGSIVFDGIDDYVDCGNLITFAQGFTLFILFKTTASTLTVMAGKYSGAQNDFWVGVLSDGTLRFSISSGGKREPTSTTVINTGNWYLGTCVWNPSTFAASLYVNGNIEQTVIGDVPFIEPNPPFVLGNFPGSNFFFPGSIALSEVYNRALTAAEVLQNYNALKGRFGL